MSFPDYNSDGYSDIIIICSYLSVSETAAGAVYSEVRIYQGKWSGTFTLEKGGCQRMRMPRLRKRLFSPSWDFWGRERRVKHPPAGNRHTSIIFRHRTEEEWDGYQLIYIDDDDIPELVKIGNSEAVGRMIAAWDGGKWLKTS